MSGYYWLDKNGGYHEISLMTERHIRNCINLIIAKRGRWRLAFLTPLVRELGQREMG